MPRIKGTAIRGILKFVKDAEGRDSIARLLEELPPASRDAYRRPILAADWYPYEAYATLLAVVSRRLGGERPEFLRSIGRSAARQDLGTVFRIVAALSSVRRIVQSSGLFWTRYCDTGRFTIVELGDESGVGRVEDFPEISPEHELVLAGWIEGVGLVAGAVDPSVRLARSVHQGSPVSEYHLRWRNP